MILVAALACITLSRAPGEPVQGGESPPESSAWENVLERFEFYGDFRWRHESDFDLEGQPDRHRERLRFRVGANYRLRDDLVLGARMVTGDPDDPNSSHVTLGSGFDEFEASLDRLFLGWTPEWLDDGFLRAGKSEHPFARNPIYGELVWDADIQPEGFVLGKLASGFLGVDEWQVHAGDYIVQEEARTRAGPWAWLTARAHRRATGVSSTSGRRSSRTPSSRLSRRTISS